MIQFYMNFYDLLFPVNLGPLTYRCDDELSHRVKPGMIVSAPLKNKISKGIVISESRGIPPVPVKDIQQLLSEAPVLNDTLMKLLGWMSAYYVAEQGLVLKNMLPREIFNRVKRRKKEIPPCNSYAGKEPDKRLFHGIHIDSDMVSVINSSIKKQIFKTFLFHAPSSAHEVSFLRAALMEADSAIVLVPEVSLIYDLFTFLRETFGDSICLFHSGLSRGEKTEAIERILTSRARIVLGTRSAVLTPVKKVSLIAVLHEHSSSYKQENTPCYNGRDVAVKRGYFDKATVLLSSICPSVESLYNCSTGKYNLLKQAGYFKRPTVNMIDMRFEKLLKPYVTKPVISESLRHIRNGQKVMFIMNRRGYATVLQCMDCNHKEECPHCGVPLVFHKQDMSLKCHYCGYMLTSLPQRCNVCKGFNIHLLGTGTQRVKEDIEEMIGVKTLRIDSDRIKKKSDTEGLVSDLLDIDYRILVGTKLMTRRPALSGKVSMAAILNADQFLNIPDFRSAERAFQEITFISDKIEPSGELFIQTRMPENYLYRYLKAYNYSAFSKEEMQRRKLLRYPPYSKLALVKFTTKKDLTEEISEVRQGMEKDVEILGPSHSLGRGGQHEIKFLLKSPSQEKLRSGVRSFLGGLKYSRNVRIKVDIDP